MIDTELVKMNINLDSLNLKNPIMPASGTFDIQDTILNKEQLVRLGALVTKSVAYGTRQGNPGPRIWETDSGMLNAVGIPSKGFEYFKANEMPLLQEVGNNIIVSIVGDSVEDYCKLVKKLDRLNDISALELNLSCPNLNDGLQFGINEEVMGELIYKIKKNTQKIIIAKLSPNVSDITRMALTAEEAGSNIVTIANTLVGMAIDIEKQIPRLGNKIGGLSGPAIRPIVVRMIWEAKKKLKVPIIGVGGVTSADDAIELFLAGATAVQVGSANFSNPYIMFDIIQGIKRYLSRKGYNSIQDIIGILD